jgi:hypothetical protein
MSKSKPLFCIIWDDQQGTAAPMGWDRECDGAVCAILSGDKLALFSSRRAARAAIEVSVRHASLCKAQRRTANGDFLEGKRFLRVVACEPPKEALRSNGEERTK